MDKQEFARIVTDLYIYYKQKEPTAEELKGTLRYWYPEFGELPAEVFTEALRRHRNDIREGRFFPKTCNIFEQLRIIFRPRFEAMFEVVRRAMRDAGSINSISLGDPRLHYAIMQYGGWPAVCAVETADLDKLKELKDALFEAYFEALQHAPEEMPERLQGLFEQQGSSRYKQREFNALAALPSARRSLGAGIAGLIAG